MVLIRLTILGFIPTFGPVFVHLYGSTRDYSLIDEHSNLNAGLGEGVSYRGRLLIALKTDISDSIDTAPSEVEVEPTQTIHEVNIEFLSLYPVFILITFLHIISQCVTNNDNS